jgi:hypothetical protein
MAPLENKIKAFSKCLKAISLPTKPMSILMQMMHCFDYWSCIKHYSLLFIFFFLEVLYIKFRALSLLGNHSITWVNLQSYYFLCLIIHSFYQTVCYIMLVISSLCVLYICVLHSLLCFSLCLKNISVRCL